MSQTIRVVASLLIAFAGADSVAAQQSEPAAIINPAIDMEGYLGVSRKAAQHRETRRVSESEFIRMSGEPGTIILDARSAARYKQLHVKGAVNLSFPDINIASLAQLIPDKSTRILIYCNNNFTGDQSAFAEKAATASLNLSTYIALYDYGYENVYELGPLIDLAEAKIEFVRAPRH